MKNTIKLNYVLTELSKRKEKGKIWNVRFSFNSNGNKVITYIGTNSKNEVIEYSLYFDMEDNYKFINLKHIEEAKNVKENSLFDKFKKKYYNVIKINKREKK